MKIYGMVSENRLFQDKVSMSIKNGYFQEAASANAEAIIFLHDYVMSYLGGILIVVLILIIVLGVMFTGTNDKREIVINFMPKGSAQRFVGEGINRKFLVTPFKKGLEKNDVTLSRLSQHNNPVYIGRKFRYPFGAKYQIKAKPYAIKAEKGLERLELLRRLAKKNKKIEYEKNINNVMKGLRKRVINFTTVDEYGDIGALYSKKYPPKPSLSEYKVYITPNQKLGIELKSKIGTKIKYLPKEIKYFYTVELKKNVMNNNIKNKRNNLFVF